MGVRAAGLLVAKKRKSIKTLNSKIKVIILLNLVLPRKLQLRRCDLEVKVAERKGMEPCCNHRVECRIVNGPSPLSHLAWVWDLGSQIPDSEVSHPSLLTAQDNLLPLYPLIAAYPPLNQEIAGEIIKGTLRQLENVPRILISRHTKKHEKDAEESEMRPITHLVDLMIHLCARYLGAKQERKKLEKAILDYIHPYRICRYLYM